MFGAFLYPVSYIFVAVSRMQYPFELEWMEGGSVDHVIRVLEGRPLYVQPSLEFIPFIYTPFYYYLSALVSLVVPISFFPLRMVSFGASIICGLVIGIIVWRETHSTYSGLLSTFLFFATYRASGGWYDIARADSLFLALLLAGIYLLRFHQGMPGYVLSGLLLALSFLTKQTALFVFVPICIYCLLSGPRRSFPFVGTLVCAFCFSNLWLEYVHKGWYFYYVFEIPRSQDFVQSIWLTFWQGDIIGVLPVVFFLSLAYVTVCLQGYCSRDWIFYIAVSFGMIGASWLNRLHLGGYPNALLPAYASLAILFGLSLHLTLGMLGKWLVGKARVASEAAIYFCVIIQFVILAYNPTDLLPTSRDYEAGQDLVNGVSSVAGDVMIPGHGYISRLAGKGKSNAHDAAIIDVLRGPDVLAKAILRQEIEDTLQHRHYIAIIADWWCEKAIAAPALSLNHPYIPMRFVFSEPDVFWTVTGYRTRPQVICVPKQ
jgi:hypothetical protein